MASWEPCPQCGSSKVRSMGMAFWLLMGLCVISFGLIITLFIPFIGIPMMGFGVLFMLISPFTKGTLQCQDCKKAWKPAKIISTQ